MEVKIERRFPVAAASQDAWAVLGDVRRTAACMPGAQITEQTGDSRFKGIVKSKVGPAQFTFGGDIEVLELDPGSRRIKMHGKGADKSGSTASMVLNAFIDDAQGQGCVLVGEATVTVGGKLAQFGNRLIIPVMDALLVQFARNFTAQALAQAAASPAAQGAPAGGMEASNGPKDHAPVPVAATAGSELNVFAFALAVIKGFFARLFGRT